MGGPHSLKEQTVLVTVILGFTLAGGRAADQTSVGDATPTLSPLQAPLQSLTGDELFARLLEHNRLRDVRLQRYSAIRSYDVANDNGKVYAEELVREEYRAPNHTTFVTKSEKGSTLVRDLVL